MTSFYISDALGETPDPITWFSSTWPYPDRLMYDLGLLGMNEAKLGQILNRTGYEVQVKDRILTVPEFAEIVTSVLGRDAVPAFVAAGLMSDETPKDVLAGIIEAVKGLDSASLTNPNAGDALVNKLQATIALIEAGLYQDALMKLQHDILRKTDGCALRGRPDKDDWVTTCEAQQRVYPLVSRAIQLLEELI